MILPRPLYVAALLGGVAMLAALPALAQPRAVNIKPLTIDKGQRQPAALPGAGSVPGAAESTAPTAAMAPNEALFDAVNRGDIAAAREAMNRGADLEARNILGLTALELSVDLGRNDITFLLLSLRSAGSSGGSVAASRAPAGKPAPARAASGTPAPAPMRVATTQAAPAPRPTPAPAPQAAPPRQALSRDPGVPAPQSGFLGFGAPAN